MRLLKELIQVMKSPSVTKKLEALSLEQKVAQLIHVPAWSNRGEKHLEELKQQVGQYEIGGIIFFQGDAPTQAQWTRQLQAGTSIPLLIGIDAEWGLGMRLRQTPSFPYQMTLGALQDVDLLFEMGREIGRQLREIGTHINYAPVVDINTEPGNPVIGFRSLGSDPERVSKLAAAYARGLETSDVLPVIKHFPGHGDTQMDSHLALPVLPHTNKRLQEVELHPFRELIRQGIPAIMSAHLHIPAWDDRPNRAVTHSKPIITQRLRKELDFQGLLFTDALDMQGVSRFMSPAEINREALLAGHDVLLFCVDVPGSIQAIKQAVAEGLIPEEEINHRCKKSLAIKELLVEPSSTQVEWNPRRAFEQTSKIRIQVAEKSVSWLKKPHTSLDWKACESWMLDMQRSQENELAHHQLNFAGGQSHERGKSWKEELKKKKGVETRMLMGNEDVLQEQGLQSRLLLVNGIGIKAKNDFDMSREHLARIDECLDQENCWLVWQGSPFALQYLKQLYKAEAVLLTYQEGIEFEKVAAAVLMGELNASGQLPISL